MRRRLMGLLLTAVLAVSGSALVINRRLEQCQAVPLLAGDILPNPALTPDSSAGLMPRGWGRGAAEIPVSGHPRGTSASFLYSRRCASRI